MMKVTKQTLIEFVEKRTSMKINQDMVFFNDISLTGLDAISFMEEFANEFTIDMSPYSPEKYHTSENDLFNLPKTILNHFFDREEKMTFTIDHLMKVIEVGIWFDSAVKV